MWKSFLIIVFILGAFTAISSSCKKKIEGMCYCTFFSGDKSQYDLRHLDKQKQIDSCAQISQNASHFAGSCKLK